MNLRFTLLAALACLVVSCDFTGNTTPDRVNTVIVGNLYGIEYDDYDFDAAVKYYEKHRPSEPQPACSQVRKGDFVARNLDYYINRNASAIIKMNRSEHRFASVGVVGCSREFSSELAASGKYAQIYEYLPLRTADGINENGVYCAVNVMPTGETSLDKDSWCSGEWGIGAAFTKPGAEHTYCTMYMVRFVLDNATSVEHALQLINDVNWYEPIDYPHDKQSQAFHWMLADKDTNCVIEFMDNRLVVTYADNLREPSFGTVMTNFTNACRKNGVWQDHGQGFERYDILAEGYPDTPESFDGMKSLMQKVWYSKYYTTPVESPDFWLSEADVEGFEAWKLYHHPEYKGDPFILGAIAAERLMWADKACWFTDDTILWFTVHNSVYDIREKKFDVIIQEGMFDMKDYMSFDLNSSFKKPLKSGQKK